MSVMKAFKFCLLFVVAACTPSTREATNPPSLPAPTVGATNYELMACQPQWSGGSCPIDRCPSQTACATEDDTDCDDVVDFGVENFDNCVNSCNPQQANADNDYMGDACDPCPQDAGNDIDKDGLCANVDNCPHVANAGQVNTDNDAHGDVCDELPNTPNPETAIAALDTRLDALEGAGTPAAIAALQYDVAALSAALAEIRTKYPQHYHGLLGLNGDPVGSSGDLNYDLPNDP